MSVFAARHLDVSQGPLGREERKGKMALSAF